MHAGVPGAVVHRETDITWMKQEGSVWRNGGVGVRFGEDTVASRLNQILANFRKRGVGFWIDADATPPDLEAHLKRRRFRCRKYFPGMCCDLDEVPDVPVPRGVTIAAVSDHGMYAQQPHPYFGRISTPIRRYELARLASLSARAPRDVFDFAAIENGRPIGACTLALSASAAGLHDVGVVADRRVAALEARWWRTPCALHASSVTNTPCSSPPVWDSARTNGSDSRKSVALGIGIAPNTPRCCPAVVERQA